MTTKTKAPAHLGKHGKALWEGIVRDYAIDDSAGLTLLSTACECLDRMKEAQALVKKHGAVFEDRYGGLKSNPANKIELDSRNGMLAALRALNLDLEPLRDGPGRPGGH